MEKMQEDEFEKIKPKCKPSECMHNNIVKLYILGAYSDYGCMDCKMCSTVLSSFERAKK